MIAKELVERSGELVESLLSHVEALRTYSNVTKQSVEDATRLGLGANILAVELLANYKPSLTGLQLLVHRALKNIENATVD